MPEIVVIFINGVVFSGMTYYAFTCIFEPSVKKRWVVLAYATYLILTNAVFFEFESGWINLAVNMTTFFALTFLFKGNIGTKFVFALLVYIMGMLGEGISFLVLSSIYYLQFGMAVSTEYILPIGRTVANVIFLPLVLTTILIFRKFVNKKAQCKHFKIPAKYTVATFSMLLGIILINTLFAFALMDRAQVETTPIIISHIISSVIIFLIIWIYNTILNHLETFEKNRLKDQMLERWEIQYSAAVSSQKVIAKLKHNLRLHFLTLSSLLREGHVEDAKKHVADEIGSFDDIITTGNMAIDAMLSYYRQKAKEMLDIELDVELMIPPDMMLDPNLTVLILGNALENAVDACTHLPPTDRYIRINAIFTTQGELLVTIANPYAVAPVVDKEGNLLTTKSDEHNHGLGLASVREMLPEEAGQIHIEYADNIFQFTLIFYNVRGENVSYVPND